MIQGFRQFFEASAPFSGTYKKGTRVKINPQGPNPQTGVVVGVKEGEKFINTADNAQQHKVVYIIKLDGGSESVVPAAQVVTED
jgi:hypothetical protein